MGKDSYFCLMKKEQFIFVREVTSTNDALRSIIEQNEPKKPVEEFTVLYADWQSKGRGMVGNVWESNPQENILASFYLTPPVLPKDQSLINIFFSLAVRKMLAKYVPSVKIKWPNDIYIHDKKIAGILMEHSIQGDKIAYTIAGVGINLNQDSFEFAPNPTSLLLETGFYNGRITLIKELYYYAQNYYQLILKGEYAQLRKEYYWHLYRFGEFHSYLVKNELIAAKIIGVDGYGQLQLQTMNGEIILCGYKEVKFY